MVGAKDMYLKYEAVKDQYLGQRATSKVQLYKSFALYPNYFGFSSIDDPEQHLTMKISIKY